MDNKEIKEKEAQKIATQEADTVSIKKDELLKLRQEAAKASDYWERCLRLQAEFDNAKKRMEKERQEFVKFAQQDIILELLDVLDNLERAVEAFELKKEDPEVFLKGIEMILSHIYEMLKKNGVSAMEAKGKTFDPHLHEALVVAESNTQPENTIVEELQKGYLLNGKVLRTAKVRVSKKIENKRQSTEEQKK